MKNNFKLFFLYLIIISTLFLISSSNWLNMWLWMEVNLISFISFLINNNEKLSIESTLIYFLIQTIASIILLFSILMKLYMNNFFYFMLLAIMIKIGSAPVHFWLPLMIEGLNWMKIFLLLTWQKINPLIMLTFNNYNFILNLFMIFSLIIGSISGLNYSSIKKMITFSSINQLSWMMLSMINNKLMKIYLLFYFFIMWIIIKSMMLFNITFMNQMFNLNNKNKFIKSFIFMNFLSLGGLPPFLGFYPKLMIILKLNNLLILFLMVIFTLITLFMYIRIIMSMLILNSIKLNKIINNYNIKKFYNLMKFTNLNNLILIMLMFIN